MRKNFILLTLLITAFLTSAQEFNCSVTINSDKIAGSNKQVFNTLQTAINEFVNQNKWTNQNYLRQEKIDCSLILTITEKSGDSFKGNIQVQSSRPVYNSNYLTPVFNFKDSDFSFEYREFEPLQYNANSFESNLISVISYYLYVILGMDADTFALEGGTAFYKQAQNILILAQQSGFKGWNQNDGTNTRFTLIDNLMSPTYKQFRTTLYNYHIKGLDKMANQKKQSKEFIAKTILNLKKIYNTRPNAFLLRVFMNSKAEEISDIFSSGPLYINASKLKEELIKISPINTSFWNKIK